MNVIVLAAGYATRLHPLTRDFPKSLLEVGGRSILERLLENVFELDVDKITLVSNARFADLFRAALPAHVDLLVNRSTKVSDRLGAVADLELALIHLEHPLAELRVVLLLGRGRATPAARAACRRLCT